MPDKKKGIDVVLGPTGRFEQPDYQAHMPKWKPGIRGKVRGKILYHLPNKRGMGRAKGNTHERETAKLLGEWIYEKPNILKRTPLSGGWSSQKMGDVMLDPEMERKGFFNPPIYVECRSYKDVLQHDVLTWAASGSPALLTKWVNEVESKCDGRLPMLVIKGNGTKAWILLRAAWLTKRTLPKVRSVAPVRLRLFPEVVGPEPFVFLMPLTAVWGLGDGESFFKEWRGDGGPAQVRRLGRASG